MAGSFVSLTIHKQSHSGGFSLWAPAKLSAEFLLIFAAPNAIASMMLLTAMFTVVLALLFTAKILT